MEKLENMQEHNRTDGNESREKEIIRKNKK